ncbi:AHH domain-containing protein [Vibrio penaeicida]|uniref:AHH domain-containing protein n=1 Tax=Vibrio penaeicida TaxID=104609 RepID=UPI000CEA457F|nr:AHH domain-containing protein [Vibrio penaeicida]
MAAVVSTSSPVMALPKRPSNPTPLELAIYNYEKQVLEYKKKQKQFKAEKRAELIKDWEHLQRERTRISIQAELQKDLESYRADALDKSPRELAMEPHHPTRILAKNLTAIAEPKPSPNHDPHHIVMGKGRWRAFDMMNVRLSMHAHGLGINDPTNGVWLPRNKKDKGHWATPNAPAHKEIHRFNYESWIVSAIGKTITSEHILKNRLRNVKMKLKTGTHPQKILQPKDATWRGNE